MWKQQQWSHVSGQGFGNRSNSHVACFFLQKRVDKQERQCDVYESKRLVLVPHRLGKQMQHVFAR